MKKNRLLLIVATIALTCGSLVAQNTKEGKRLTEEQRIEKRVQRMQERLCLDDETSAKFAPLYKAYIQEMKACHKAPDPNIKKESRTDEQIKERMKGHFEMRQKMLDTQEKYFNEFQKILNARQLEKIFQPGHPKGKFRLGTPRGNSWHNTNGMMVPKDPRCHPKPEKHPLLEMLQPDLKKRYKIKPIS